MAFISADRVKETSTTTGTGDFTLDGAVSGFKAFGDVCSIGDSVYYVIYQEATGDFEVGLGLLTGATNNLERFGVVSSSNSNALVDFGAGGKVVFLTVPAVKLLQQDFFGNLTVSGGDTTFTGLDFDTDFSGNITLDAGGTVILQDSGSTQLTVNSNEVVNFADEFVATTSRISPTLFPSTNVMVFGGFASNGFIYSGTDNHLHIGNTSGGVTLDIDSSGDFEVMNNGSDLLIQADANSVRLYDSGSLSMYTLGTGIYVLGSVSMGGSVFTNGLDMGDSDEIRLGTGDDTVIDFDGTNYTHNQIAGDIVFQNNGTQAFVIDESGNSAFHSSATSPWDTLGRYKGVDFAGTGAIWGDTTDPRSGLLNNAYYDGSNYILMDDGIGNLMWMNGTDGSIRLYDLKGATDTAGETATVNNTVTLFPADNNNQGSKLLVDGLIEGEGAALFVGINNNVSVNSSGVKAIVNTSEVALNRGGWTLTTSRITCPQDGIYQVTFMVRIDSAVVRAAPQVLLSKNGTSYTQYASTGYIRNSSGHNNASLHITWCGSLAENDYIEFNFAPDGATGTVNTVIDMGYGICIMPQPMRYAVTSRF